MRQHAIYTTILIFMLSYTCQLYGQINYSAENPNINMQDGWIEVLALGSSQPFKFFLFETNSFTPLAESAIGFTTGSFRFKSLGPGSYYVLVKDAFGCETIFEDIILQEEQRCIIDYYVNSFKLVTEINYGTDISTDDGEIEIILANPALFQINWEGPAGFTSSDNYLQDLPSGRYILTITDLQFPECQITEEFYLPFCATFAGDDEILEIGNLSMVEIGEGQVTSPTFGSCNGRIELPLVLNRSDRAFKIIWLDENENVIGYNSRIIEDLCPGTYQAKIIDGCFGEQEQIFSLFDCSVDPITLNPVNDCTDPDYGGAFLLSLSGGVNPRLNTKWIENENGRTYHAEDARGCKTEYAFNYAEIGDWDIRIEVLKPYNGISSPIIALTILNVDEQQAPFSIVGLPLEIPVNVSTEIVLNGVQSGTLPLEIENKNGCTRIAFIEITDCSNYENKSPLTSQIQVDTGNGEFKDPDQNSQCLGEVALQILVQGGLAPYDVFVTSPNNSSWSGTSVTDTEDGTLTFSDLPANSNFDVRIVDDCSETINKVINVCNLCDFNYEADGRKFLLGSNNSLELEFEFACGIGFVPNFFGKNPRIKLNKKDNLIQDWELPITIEWPSDGGVTTISRDENGDIVLNNPSGDNSGVDVDDELRINGEPLVTTVTRGDGCVLTIPFEYASVEITSGSYVTGEALKGLVSENQEELANAYIGAAECRICIPFNENVFTNPPSNDCFTNSDSPRYFKWTPTNPNNPCNGGGTLSFVEIERFVGDFEELNRIDIPIGPNQSVFEIIDDGSLSNAVRTAIEAVKEQDCVEGGACFFNLIGSFPDIDKLIAAPFCAERNDPDKCNTPCKEGELCIEGFCYDPTSCQDLVISKLNVSDEPTNETYFIPESMVGKKVNLIWDNFGIADELSITGVITYFSGCTSRFSDTTSFIINESGALKVRVKDNCSDTNGSTQYTLTLSCSDGNLLEIQDESEFRTLSKDLKIINNEVLFTAYPNPSNNYFNLVVDSKSAVKYLVLIYNSIGEIVEEYRIGSGKELRILENRPQGIYTATLFTENNFQIVKQLIKVE